MTSPPRRDSTIAAVLGFLWPGVGYLYAGRGLQGLLLLLLFPALGVAIVMLAVLLPVRVACVVVPVVLTLALRLGFAHGAARAASAFPADEPVPRFSRWYSCLAAVVLATVVAQLWVHGYRTSLAEAFKIPTGAMGPTILMGDHVMVTKWDYGWREPLLGHLITEPRPPTRGALVVFRLPENRSVAFIKRCIGLPGETVEIRGTTVLIDGEALDEPYAAYLESSPSVVGLDPRLDVARTWGPRVVPEGQYFMLGDNRDNSRDSRFWGFVPQRDLLGRAQVVYWSYEATREEFHRRGLKEWILATLSSFARTRWNRIGVRFEQQ